MISLVQRLLHKNKIIRNVLTLSAGSATAQIMSLLIMPLLTRIYSPSDFGTFALFVGITSIISIIVTGRYELAIALPEKDEEAFHLVILSIILAFVSSIIILFILLLFNDFILKKLFTPKLNDLFYWISIYSFLIGLYRIIDYWGFRKKYYNQLAINRIIDRGSTGTMQLGFPFLFPIDKTGLITGEILGRLLSSAYMMLYSWKQQKFLFSSFKIYSLLLVGKKYQRFPKYSVASYGICTISLYLPMFMLDLFFGSAVVGVFALTERALRGPLFLIGTNIHDIFRQRAVEEYNQTGNCYKIYVETFRNLCIVSFVIFVPLFFVSPILFEVVFGKEWAKAGEYAQIMMPMIGLQFIANPLSAMFIVAQKQRLDLYFQICLFVGMILSFAVGIYYPDPKIVLGSFSLFMFLWKLINIKFSYSLAKG